MWLITPRGFFSAVQKPGDAKDQMLTIRARDKADLENLKDLLPDAKPFKEKGYTDYPWRIRVPQKDWALATATMSLEIDYSNFKDEVTRTQGKARHDIYSQIWGVLLQVEPGYKATSYGGSYTPSRWASHAWKPGDRVWDSWKKKAATVESFKKNRLYVIYDDAPGVKQEMTVKSDAKPLRIVGDRVWDNYYGDFGEITSLDPLTLLYEDGEYSGALVQFDDLDDGDKKVEADLEAELASAVEPPVAQKQLPQKTGGGKRPGQGSQKSLFPELDAGTRSQPKRGGQSRSVSRSTQKRSQGKKKNGPR